MRDYPNINKANSPANLISQAYVDEIMQACALAGKPQLAAQFIEKGFSRAVVVDALLKARAEEDEAREIVGHIPDSKRSGHKSFNDPEEAQEVFDRRSARVRDVAEQLKGAR